MAKCRALLLSKTRNGEDFFGDFSEFQYYAAKFYRISKYANFIGKYAHYFRNMLAYAPKNSNAFESRNMLDFEN